MDRRLVDAAMAGDVEKLHQLLRENPLLLHKVALTSVENPLHTTSAYGHVDFTKEMMRLKPGFAKELNEDGFSPLHIAAANGYAEIVNEMLKVDEKLCHLPGREGRTSLHCAAIKGRDDVISLMLSICGECVEDLTVREETALHLSVKNNQFGGIRVLMDWIRDTKKEGVLNMKDEQGNTLLHLATWKKQRQVILLLLGNTTTGTLSLEVNAMNNAGLTALDVLLSFSSEAGDREIEQILRCAGAIRARDVATLSSIPSVDSYFPSSVNSPTTPERGLSRQKDLVEYFKFKKGRDSPGEARNALLVIAVLVATATFQVGLNPPGGVWQDNDHTLHGTNTTTSNEKRNYAGLSIMGSMNAVGFAIFMGSNSVGFALSLYMINLLTIKFPLQLELQICMFAMFCTYNTAVISLAPDNLKLYLILLTSILPGMTHPLVMFLREVIKRVTKLIKDKINRHRAC